MYKKIHLGHYQMAQSQIMQFYILLVAAPYPNRIGATSTGRAHSYSVRFFHLLIDSWQKNMGQIWDRTTRFFINKGHSLALSTHVPYFRQKFQYSCPIKCPLYFHPESHFYIVIEYDTYK